MPYQEEAAQKPEGAVWLRLLQLGAIAGPILLFLSLGFLSRAWYAVAPYGSASDYDWFLAGERFREGLYSALLGALLLSGSIFWWLELQKVDPQRGRRWTRRRLRVWIVFAFGLVGTGLLLAAALLAYASPAQRDVVLTNQDFGPPYGGVDGGDYSYQWRNTSVELREGEFVAAQLVVRYFSDTGELVHSATSSAYIAPADWSEPFLQLYHYDAVPQDGSYLIFVQVYVCPYSPPCYDINLSTVEGAVAVIDPTAYPPAELMLGIAGTTTFIAPIAAEVSRPKPADEGWELR